MLLPVSDICKWLRESASTLRNGGAEASAVVYEEIAERLETELRDPKFYTARTKRAVNSGGAL